MSQQDPVIPGDGQGDDLQTVGEAIGAFMAEMAKGAIIGGVLMGRFGHFGLAAGIIVGGVRGGYMARDAIAPKGRIQMEEDFEDVFHDPVEKALKGRAKSLSANLRGTKNLDRHFRGGMTDDMLAPKSYCYKFCDRIGEKRPAFREMCVKIVYAKAEDFADTWNRNISRGHL